MSKDYYQTLGIEKSASKEDVKKAFRKLAHEHHPDKKGGNEAKFKEINEAYSVLSDDKKRSEYDSYGRVFNNNGAGGGPAGAGFEGFDFSGFTGGTGGFQDFDLGDIFGDIFNGGGQRRVKRGRDISVDIELSFKEAVFGVDRKIVLTKTSVCDICKGSGSKSGSDFVTCGTCSGKGKIREVRRSFIGSFNTERICETCQGKGQIPKEKCQKCHGSGIARGEQELSVKIPAGIENGEMVRLSGAGEAVNGGVTGDLYIKVHVVPHATFRKEGYNLIMNLNVKLSDALLGGEYNINTLDGDIKVKIPEGIAFGEILRVKGKGVATNKGKRGDLLIKINIELPRKLSREAKKTIEELKKEGV
ncbi:MAG: molecular chaperone DnaJ [Parcubacteria group bacterium]|nr:molecular chaperone DnaJ [Parcubacteria group bacterium]